MLRDKLKLALNSTEVDTILHRRQGLIHIDKKIRRNPKFPLGLMDVLDIPKLSASYRVLYNAKGRFVFVKLKKKEAQFKLCRVQKKATGPNKVCYFVTHDGRTLRYINPDVEMNDTLKLNLETNEVEGIFKMKVDNVVYAMNGNNRGRVGVVKHISKFHGNHDLITIKDARGHTFTTRVSYVMAIGTGSKSVITLPKEMGLRNSIVEE